MSQVYGILSPELILIVYILPAEISLLFTFCFLLCLGLLIVEICVPNFTLT